MTWRAARASGDRDLNPFIVRIDPHASASGLAAGQTVWVTPTLGQ